jgi:hypothetical protein
MIIRFLDREDLFTCTLLRGLEVYGLSDEVWFLTVRISPLGEVFSSLVNDLI